MLPRGQVQRTNKGRWRMLRFGTYSGHCAGNSGGTLPGQVLSVARACTNEVPGVMSCTGVTFEQNIFGRIQTTGMCYSDFHHAGYSALDWKGIKVDCSTNSSAEEEMYFFDNIPNTTDGISQPPPNTGYVQQVDGTAGARLEYMHGQHTEKLRKHPKEIQVLQWPLVQHPGAARSGYCTQLHV